MDFKIKIFCDFVLRNDFKLFVLPNIGHWGEKEQYIQFCKYFLQKTNSFRILKSKQCTSSRTRYTRLLHHR